MSEEFLDLLSSKRKYPRRQMSKKVGVIFAGTYFLCESTEVGEGGMAFISDYVLQEGRNLVITFQVPLGDFISIRGEIRMVHKKDGRMIHGIAFRNLDFIVKRQIRTYVSNWTQNS